MNDNRNSDAAFLWVEALMGGKIVDKELQGRWRPHWILDLDIQGAKKRVLLRGYRNPGYTEADASGSIALLMQEARVLEALQEVPIKLPRYYGHNAELGWMLMEFVEGEAELINVPDESQRFLLYQQYVEQIASLHAYPLEKINVPTSLQGPTSCQSYRQALIDKLVPPYRAMQRRHPEPTVELGLQWSLNNTISDERPLCIGFGDIGPGQFMFKGKELTTLIDIEYAQVCDPLAEIGMMRGRDITYHVGNMPAHVKHYGEHYEKLTGISLSLESLQYWSIAGYALWVTQTVGGTQRPDASMVDLAFMFSYEVQMKRFTLEALAEKYDIQLMPPEFPGLNRTTTLRRLHETMVAQFSEYYQKIAKETDQQEFVKYSKSIAETLMRGDSSHLQIENDNLNELSELLGKSVSDLEGGMNELEESIRKDHMFDFEKRLNFLYRYESRREYLYEPMQVASGVSVRMPLDRMEL